MIRLGGLVSQKAFGKFEMGKVISNPFANAFIKEGEGEDHEVSMANNSIDIIIKMATELKAKMGEDEKQIPAWIQDHIAKAENLISQASGNYHEYGDSNESINEEPAKSTGERIQNLNNRIKVLRAKIGAQKDAVKRTELQNTLKNALQSLSSIKSDFGIKKESINEDNTAFETLMLIRNLEQTNKLLAQDLKTSKRLPNDKKENIKKSIVVNQGLINYYKETYKNLKNNESVNEASPCWKGYKQVGMKDKGGRQVPNCVPNESVVKEISGRTPKIFVKTAAVEKKIKELMADRKKAVVPYNTEKDPKKKETLKQILIKLTNQIKGYEKNLVQLRDMEEEYLQQMHADAELDTTGL
jgi:flagellar biosynthesis chaperone FliJ